MLAMTKSETVGLRITAALLASCALIAFLRSLVHLVAIVIDIKQSRQLTSRNNIEFVLFLGLTYALIKLRSGLMNRQTWSRNAAQMSGFVLLVWVGKTLVFPEAYDPKAPDADEIVGLFVIYFAVVGVWLITFLSVPGVRKKFSVHPLQTSH